MDSSKKSPGAAGSGEKDRNPGRSTEEGSAERQPADDPDHIDWAEPDLPASLNEELEETLGDNPDKLLGCGG